MGRRIHPQLRRALGLSALLTALVLIVSACGGEGGGTGKASPVADETTPAKQEPAAEGTGKDPDTIGADSSSKPSKAVLAEIDEKGGEERYVKYIALQEVDPFWAQQFAQGADFQQYTGGDGGPSYTSARLIMVSDKPIETGGCNFARKKRGTFYCHLDNTIYLVPKEVLKGAEEHGPFTLAFAVAHEWGHHVQNQLGYHAEDQSPASSDSRAFENNADCLAGLWARSYYERGRLDRRAILEGMNFTYSAGYRGTEEDGGVGWGTPEERVRWFLTGYTSGEFSECSGAWRGTGLHKRVSQ